MTLTEKTDLYLLEIVREYMISFKYPTLTPEAVEILIARAKRREEDCPLKVDAVEKALEDTLRLGGMGAGGAGIVNYRQGAQAAIKAWLTPVTTTSEKEHP